MLRQIYKLKWQIAIFSAKRVTTSHFFCYLCADIRGAKYPTASKTCSKGLAEIIPIEPKRVMPEREEYKSHTPLFKLFTN